MAKSLVPPDVKIKQGGWRCDWSIEWTRAVLLARFPIYLGSGPCSNSAACKTKLEPGLVRKWVGGQNNMWQSGGKETR